MPGSRAPAIPPLARPHTQRFKFGAGGVPASSSKRRVGPAPAPRVACPRPRPPPTPGLPRRSALPAGPQPDTPRGPSVSRGRLPRHGTGPRHTMAAARHSTLDFTLGTKGEDSVRHLHGHRGHSGGCGGRAAAARPFPPRLRGLRPQGQAPPGRARRAEQCGRPRGACVFPAVALSTLRALVHRRRPRRAPAVPAAVWSSAQSRSLAAVRSLGEPRPCEPAHRPSGPGASVHAGSPPSTPRCWGGGSL